MKAHPDAIRIIKKRMSSEKFDGFREHLLKMIEDAPPRILEIKYEIVVDLMVFKIIADGRVSTVVNFLERGIGIWKC